MSASALATRALILRARQPGCARGISLMPQFARIFSSRLLRPQPGGSGWITRSQFAAHRLHPSSTSCATWSGSMSIRRPEQPISIGNGRRASADRDAQVEATRGRERQAEADRRRPIARQGDAAGRHPPKALRPVRQRKRIDEMRGEWNVSIRRACRVFEVDTSTYHYKSPRTGRPRTVCQTRVRCAAAA
jgi:hypothetical protein